MTEKKEIKVEELSFKQRVLLVQSELNAPKNQYNKFGGYAYRNCEDIYNAVKPLLKKYLLSLVITDDVVVIGDRFYIKATATVFDTLSTEMLKNVSFAREELTKKGMDSSQVTGASSSYARKYALNGLFLIDDVKDSDTTNKGEFVNEEVENGKVRSFMDDYFFKHPEQRVPFLNKYHIETVDKIDTVLTYKQIDSIITKMKKEGNND